MIANSYWRHYRSAGHVGLQRLSGFFVVSNMIVVVGIDAIKISGAYEITRAMMGLYQTTRGQIASSLDPQIGPQRCPEETGRKRIDIFRNA